MTALQSQEPIPTGGGLIRHVAVASGPFGAAGVQFLLSLILLRVLEPAAFGAFSLLFLISQLLLLVWSALFCAPLLLAMTGKGDAEGVRAILAANVLGALACGLLLFGLAFPLGLSVGAAAAFALFTSLSLLRWLGRSVCYARDDSGRVILSDHGYSLVLLLATLGITLVPGGRALDLACLALAAAMLCALAGLGAPFARLQLAALHPRGLRSALGRYRQIWRTQAGWSLAGSATGEFIASNQALLVTAVLGPAAFAPLAASYLLVRPIPIAITAMAEYERARMASLLDRPGRQGDLRPLVAVFTLAMLLVWLGTGALAAALLSVAPGLLFPSGAYAVPVLAVATGLWMAVMLPRCLRAPAITALQAAGAFRPTATAGAAGSALSLVGVGILLPLVPPVWTLLGTLAGELLATALAWRALATRVHWR